MAIKFLDETEDKKVTGGVRFLDEPEPQLQHDDSWMYKVASEQQIEDWRKKGSIGFIEAFNRFDKWDIVPYLGSAKDGIESTAMYMKLQKAAKGETLSTQEQQEVSEFLRDYTEIQARGYTLGGNFVNAALSSVPFMVEAGVTIGTFGAGAGATAGTTGAKVAGKTALKGLTKQVLKTQVKMLPTTTKNFGDRLLNDGIAITDKGQAIAKEAENSPATTAVKALADTNIELATEAFVGKLFRPVASSIGVGTKKVMPKKLVTALDGLGKTKGGKLASELLKARDKVGFNGFLEEHGEERVSELLKTIFDLDQEEGYSFEQFLNAAVPSVDEFLITSGVIAVQGGMSIGTYRAIKALERKGVQKEDVENIKTQMSEIEKEKIASDLESAEPKVVEESPPGVEQMEEISDEQPRYDYGITEEGTGFIPETQTTGNKNDVGEKTGMAEEFAKAAETEQAEINTFVGKTKGKSDSPKQIEEARKRAIRNEIKTKDKELNQLSKQWDRAFKEGDENEARQIEKEMDKLIGERQNLEQEREFLNAGVRTKTGIVEENKDLTFGAKEFQDDIIGVKRSERVLKAINKGFKSGVKMTKASLKIAQKEYKNLVRLLPQSERGKVAFDFQKFNSVEQAAKNIDEFQNKINKILEKSELRAYNKAIARQLKFAKPTKLSSKKASKSARGFKTNEIGEEAGNTVADIQAVLGKIRSWVKDGEEINDEAVTEALNDAMTKEDKVTVEITDAITGFRNGNLEKTKKLYDILDSLLEGRKTAAMLKMEAERQVLEQDLKTGTESIQGDKPANAEQPPITTKEKVKVFMRQLGHSFYSVVGKLDIISMHDTQTEKNSVSGKKVSRLSAMFDTLKSTSKELDGIYTVRKKFTDVLTKFESLKDLANERKYLKFMSEKGRKNVDLQFTSAAGKNITLKLSKTELYDFYMKFKAAKVDPVIKASLLNGNKFTFIEDNPTASTEQAVLNAMSEKEDVDFAEAMLEFYDWYHDRINTEYFRPKYGIDMTKNKYYSPAPKENVDFGSATMNAVSSYMPTVAPKGTKERTGSTKAIKMNDAVIELVSHIGDMERAIAWDTTITRMRNFFGNAEVAKVIEHKYGKTMLEAIREDIIRLSNGYGDITKGYQKIINDLRNNYTSATLGLDPSKGVKQLVSYFAWLDVMNPVELTKGTVDFFKNFEEATKTLNTSSLLRERGVNINADMANIKHSKSELSNFLTSPTFTNWKYLFIKLGDRAPIYAGGWGYYKKALAASGSHEKAIEEFERFYDNVQQSGNMYQLTQWQTGNAIERLFTSYLSSPNQYLRRELDAIRHLATKRISATEAAKTLAIYHIVLPSVFQWVANFGRWDAEDQLRAALLGNVNGAFIMGDLFEHLINCSLVIAGLMDEKDVFDASLPLYDQFNKIKDGFLKIKSDDIEMEDVLAGLWEVSKTSTELTTGLPVNKMQSVTTGLYELFSPEEDDKVGAGAKFMGWSPYIVKKRREEDSGSKMAWQ